MVDDCYVTAGLLDALLELAADREPEAVSTLLAVTRAGELDAADGGDASGAGRADSADSAAPANGAAPTDDATTADGAASANGAAQTNDAAPTDGAAPPDGAASVDADSTGASVGWGGLDPGTPVFTDFYVPSEGRSVDAVFGVDVSIPHGQAQGRFVSHPQGELEVSTTDDLHEVVLVAAPPWRREHVAAFDRSGQRLALRVVHAAPPERPFDG